MFEITAMPKYSRIKTVSWSNLYLLSEWNCIECMSKSNNISNNFSGEKEAFHIACEYEKECVYVRIFSLAFGKKDLMRIWQALEVL